MFKKINIKRVAADIAGAVVGAGVMSSLSVAVDKAIGEEIDKQSCFNNGLFGATLGAWATDTYMATRIPSELIDEVIDAEVITDETK